MTRYGTLLGLHGKPTDRVIIVRKGPKTTRVKLPWPNKPGFNPDEVRVDTGTVLDDGGELWKKCQRTPHAATWLSYSGQPQGLLHVQRVYKNVIKASLYEGNGSWSQVEDFHPDNVRFDAGAGWPKSNTDNLLNSTSIDQLSVATPTPADTPSQVEKTIQSAQQAVKRGRRVGYLRVSHTGQTLAAQREMLGVLDQEFVDEVSVRSPDQWPGVDKCVAYLRTSDELVVSSIDRLARSLEDLQAIIGYVTAQGASVYFLQEGLVFSAADQDPQATLLLRALGSFVDFERSIIREQQAEGIALAKKEGKRPGRKKALSPEQIAQVRARIEAGESKSSIAQDLGVGRATLYRALAE